MIKRISIFLFLFALILLFTNIFVANASDIDAKAYMLMDVKTNRVLYSHNSSAKLPMASTTKIMTVILAIESGRLDEMVTISREASIQEGSSIYLKEGEKIKLEDLLYAIMLHSGNDASVAVAEHLCGTVEKFAELMNEKARQIGANNTNFKNPHGLPDDEHYTTAFDLGLITCYALRNDTFAQIVKTKRKTIPGPEEENWDRVLTNKNKMLWQFGGGDGVKTGYTKKAGRCLVSSATREDWQLASVVLNCGDMWNASSQLLEYGFNNYKKIKAIDKDEPFKEIPVIKGKKKLAKVYPAEDLYGPIKISGNEEEVIIKENLDNKVKAPIYENKKAGTLEAYIGDFCIGKTDLIYKENIESTSILYNVKKILKGFK
ncbi:D-alanyl-D-alanine carboxypeptidase family protein [Lutispora saccharofermentans]|uniref:serine-type D-Ala-D-Ala carboxypeptidase n=1 Tax=Lutispora saccharofermentans TaxID=3024236 RepID=A0ABT1NF18_9FIRM|nr:D-alanyl-D-alanine carboxypeptidase family protein [Lutispora saccharofermentans]MCQ1529857.1 D-alanyl-D-alanine carboxypeptidase [Lutispora saccharofermentans]